MKTTLKFTQNVLNEEAEGANNAKPYFLEEWINGNFIKTITDPGSPLIEFALDEMKNTMCGKDLQVRKKKEGGISINQEFRQSTKEYQVLWKAFDQRT